MRAACTSPEDRLDALALALLPGVGPRTYRERVASFPSAAEAFRVTVAFPDQGRCRDDARHMADDGARSGARLLLLDDTEYPSALRHLGDPPPFVFIVGNVALVERPCVAIVGTRRATPYGERVTATIAGGLADAGVCVVSGMARGIDAAAHRQALPRPGGTIAVLGTGVDVAYPVGHRALHRAIADRGLLISEFPCGARAARASFPRRNRIIAALARLTIVVEAGEGSGARITAEHASDLGRDVAAVPGPIDSPQSAFSNSLIRDGAHAILTADDALTLIGLREAGARPFPIEPELHGDERAVWQALAGGAADLDWVVGHTGLTPQRALTAVTSLELSGLVETSPVGDLRRRRG